MRHINHGVFKRLVQTLQFNTQFRTKLGVKVRQWFVEQENIDIANQSATDGNTLALTTRQFARLALQKWLDLQDFSSTSNTFVDFRPRNPRHLKTEGQVLFHRHLWIKRIGLEHHANPAILWFHPGDIFALDENLTFCCIQQTGNAVQKCRFTATG